MIITNNFAAMNAQRNFNINTNNKNKRTEKLSSGLRINRAADDAAGLTISESMRAQIRGLNRGTANAEDGISWIQVGDGAMQEVHAILDRMEELTIQALNDTNTEEDRAALQMEFDALQSEIDRIRETTQFNTKNIFTNHEDTYFQTEGNVLWDQGQKHAIINGENDLTVTYSETEGGEEKTFTINVPEGVYTTQELIDEIDDAMEEAGIHKEGFNLEYTDKGTCNLNYEGGEYVGEISGGLSYLLRDTYNGASVGALLGTNKLYDQGTLRVQTGKNDEMKFKCLAFDGSEKDVSVKLSQGLKTKQEIIDEINGQLEAQGADAKAVEYGDSIKVVSDTSVITGFKGNMFQIEGGSNLDIYSGVFYDNIQYGNVTKEPAVFKGGLVIPNSTSDLVNEEFDHYTIDDSNNVLSLSVDGGSNVDITLDKGRYTVSDMVQTLNKKFKDNNLKLVASIQTASGSNFTGITLKTESEGVDSSIDVDSTSSAYDTLFTKKNYNNVTSSIWPSYDTTKDSTPSFTSGKILSSANIPLEITSGVNDEFKLVINNSNAYTIKLDAGNYLSAEDLKNEINNKLNGSEALSGYKGKIDVSLNNGKLVLSGVKGSGVSDVKCEASGTNKGYKNLFVGEKVNETVKKASGKDSIILNTVIDEPQKVNDDNKTMNVKVDGSNRTINFPTGDLSKQEILDKINEALKGSTTTSDRKFNSLSATGGETYNNVTLSGNGNTSSPSKTFTKSGSSVYEQGTNLPVSNTPATITIDKPINSTITIDSNNDGIQITSTYQDRDLTTKNITKLIKISPGEYTAKQLVSELQKQINNQFGTNEGGIKVGLDKNNQLTFTSNLTSSGNTVIDGATTKISCDTANSTFLKELYTTRSAATAKTNSALQSNIVIDGSSNQFEFTLDGEKKSVNLNSGTYSRQSFVDELNRAFTANGIKATASLDGGALRLTGTEVGTGHTIKYNNQSGGSSATKLFGDLKSESQASSTASIATQSAIVIDDDSNKYNITVNGVNYNLELKNGTYNASTFTSMLNDVFTENGVRLTATQNNGYITYKTMDKGLGASFRLQYETGGNSMKAIYGESQTVKKTVEASYTPDGKLQLTSKEKDTQLEVSSDKGGFAMTNEKTTVDVNPEIEKGYSSTKKAYIDGVNLKGEPINLDEWSKKLNFKFYDNGIEKNVNIELDAKSYSYDELKEALQQKIDGSVGSNKINVSVGGSGVRLECEKPGYDNRMIGFSGGFYNQVICETTEYHNTLSVKNDVNGTQHVNKAFAVGRRDIRNNSIEIEKGLNDKLEFDLTYPGSNKTISVTMDEGKYSGSSLVKELQEKIDEQLENLGLDKGLIRAQIGGVNTGVVGSNDNNALCLIIDDKGNVSAPEEGQYVIDGIRGSSAFSIFYESDGKMVPAYIKGSKDLSKGAEITADNNELSFDVDGSNYKITLDEGKYSKEELIDKINEKLGAQSAPVVAKLEGENLKLCYNQYGKHSIDNVGGSAKSSLFFQENKGDGKKQDLFIQLSGNAGDAALGTDERGYSKNRDYINIDRINLSTVDLGINSITISQPKYAEKALTRIQAAIDKVSDKRTDYGALQNRLEHTVLGNDNTSENVQASESRLRDANMADEMVEYAKLSILQQVGQSLIAQANSNQEMVLGLIQ